MEHKDIKFPWWVQNAIPTAYDDSLSIYEVFSKLWYHYLSLINYLNDKSTPKINELVDDRNNTIRTKINELINSAKSYLNIVKDKINTEDELRLTNTNTMNTNINTIGINNAIIKKMFDAISDYSKSVSNTLYNGTLDVIKFLDYDDSTNTLNVQQSNTELINALVSPSLAELTQLSTTNNVIDEWSQPDTIESLIKELDKYE